MVTSRSQINADAEYIETLGRRRWDEYKEMATEMRFYGIFVEIVADMRVEHKFYDVRKRSDVVWNQFHLGKLAFLIRIIWLIEDVN